MKPGHPERARLLTAAGACLLLALLAPQARCAEATPQTFATPEEAASALARAAKAYDADALRSLFGPAAEELQNPDRVQATNELDTFTAAFEAGHRLVREADDRCVLEAGALFWPFPIPLVKRETGWAFDTAAGLEELINRRIGRNELAALSAARAYVDAQRDYATRDRDGDEVLEFAQRIVSSPDQKDGLYWPPEADGALSPLGPLVAQAQHEGYASTPRAGEAAPEPYHGYYFKILVGQGRSAPGGRYDYVINGNMIGGFALVAWPAAYGETGVMTFIVNQLGRVYQKDLGPDTARTAQRLKLYEPDATWSVSTD